MRTIPISTLRTNLARTLDAVVNDKEVIILRKHSAAVIVSFDVYRSLQETAYLLGSPANARRLFRSIEQLDRKQGKTPIGHM